MKNIITSLNSIVNKAKKGVRISFVFSISMIFLIAYSLQLTTVYADYEDTGEGARAVGMGNAFTALADDPFGIYYNPAGLGFIRQSQIGTDYGKLWLGLDDDSDMSTSFISVVIPIFITESGKITINKYPKQKPVKKISKTKLIKEDKKKAKEKLLLMLKGDKAKKTDTTTSVTGSSTTFSAVQSTVSVTAPQGPAITKEKSVVKHFGTFALGWRNFSLLNFYQESAYYLSFGKSYKDRLSFGMNVKFLSEKYTIDDYLKLSPVFDYGKKDTVTNYSVDAGLIYNVLPRFFVGLSASDINQPDLGLSQADQLPATYRLGLAWRQKNLKWAIDCINNSNKYYAALGAERWLNETFALRGGLEMGGKNYINSGLGFSINFVTAQLDYAFQIPLAGMKDIGGTHRVSLVFKFGGRPKEELEPGSLELYYSNLKDEVANLKYNLNKEQTEKKKLEEVLIEESTMRIRERIKAAESKPHAEERKKVIAATEDVTQKSHIVRKAETLQSISKDYYGDDKYWNNIYQANKDDMGRGGVLVPNQVLVIPALSQSITASPSPAKAEASPDNNAIKTISVDNSIQLIEVKPTPVAAEPPKQKPKETKKEKPKPAKVKPVSTGPKIHVVSAGESLQSIAQKYYNDSGRWKDIYKANKDKVIGGQITPGQEIVIPQ